MKKSLILASDEVWKALLGTDSLFVLHRTSSSSVELCRKQPIKELVGFRVRISDNQVHYEVVQIEIGKTRPSGARTESLFNLTESARYSRAKILLL